MAKIRDLRNIHKAVSDDKVPPFFSSVSGSVNKAEISIIRNKIKSYNQPQRNHNTLIR